LDISDRPSLKQTTQLNSFERNDIYEARKESHGRSYCEARMEEASGKAVSEEESEGQEGKTDQKAAATRVSLKTISYAPAALHLTIRGLNMLYSEED